MEDLAVFKDLVIQSHKGPYSVSFSESPILNVSKLYEGDAHYIIDANVARLYKMELFDEEHITNK